MEYPLNRPSVCVVLGIDKKEVFIVGSEGVVLASGPYPGNVAALILETALRYGVTVTCPPSIGSLNPEGAEEYRERIDKLRIDRIRSRNDCGNPVLD